MSANSAGELTRMQQVLLRSAAERPDRRVLSQFPKKSPGSVALSIKPLIARGLIVQTRVLPGETPWRGALAEPGHTLMVSEAGLVAIGMDPVALPETVRAASLPSPHSKLGQVVALARREEGVTIAQICELTGWQQHTARAVISRSLRRLPGLCVETLKASGAPTRYRIVARISQ